MVHVSHPYATYSVAVITGDSDSVSFVIVCNLDIDSRKVSTCVKRAPGAHSREIIDSYECMRRGRVDIGKVVSECSLGRNKTACTGQDDGSIETRSGNYIASPFVRLSSVQTVEC